MGIPYLFQQLSHRYPSLCATVTANQLPYYDYFYIDVNILVHRAVEKRCRLPMERVDEEFYSEPRIYERILRWIETLFRLVRPKKLLFLSICGVAPRAKWNTQRKRRERQNGNNEDGEENVFDKNCLSVGTEFMNRFEDVLNAFVTSKIKYDHSWQKCEVAVSGPSCPGEGSIKIIEYIRSLKLTLEYKENARHCIYSCDNDFIFLGLALRERYITFMQESKKPAHRLAALCSNDIKHEFVVIHFELLRQYLEMEFSGCKDEMKFPFDMDRIADDWVLICMLFGNDYLPNLPYFNVREDALAIFFDAYKEALPILDDYINKNGFLNMDHFDQFVGILSKREIYLCEQTLAEQRKTSITERLSELKIAGDPTQPHLSESDFSKMKKEFYMAEGVRESDLNVMTINYIKMIQWNLFYYYRGSYSWSFHYQYPVAPFISDMLCAQDDQVFVFDVDHAVKPIEHLFAILPTSSWHFLPKCFHRFLNDDLIVKKELEDVLSDFINSYEDFLAEEEKERNKEKSLRIHRFKRGGKILEGYVETRTISGNLSSTKGIMQTATQAPGGQAWNVEFSALEMLRSSGKFDEKEKRIIIKLENDLNDDPDKIANQYLDQVVQINWPHANEAKVVAILTSTKAYWSASHMRPVSDANSFKMHAEYLKNRYNQLGIEIGAITAIALVHPFFYSEYKPATSDGDQLHLIKQWDESILQPVPLQTLIKWPAYEPAVKFIEKELLKLATKVGYPTVVLVGKNSRYYGEMVSVVETVNLKSSGRVHILGYVDKDPNFTKAKATHCATKLEVIGDYRQPFAVANQLGIENRVLSIITGNCYVNLTDRSNSTPDQHPKLMSIGLQLKCRKTMTMLPKYVKSVGNFWVFSKDAVELVENYMKKFPRVFEVLASNENGLAVSDFDENNNNNGLDYLTEVCKWLKEQPHYGHAKKPANFVRMSDSAIQEMKLAVEQAYLIEPTNIKLQVKWPNIFIPELNNIFVIPKPDTIYKLLDRVVFVQSGYPMPVGAKGTVIAIEPMQDTDGTSLTENEIYALEILMDFPFKITSDYPHENLFQNFQCHYVYRTRSTNMLINISNH